MRFGRRESAQAVLDEPLDSTPAAEMSGGPAKSGDGGDTMNEWRSTFLDKLSQAQSRWLRKFEDVLENSIMPAFSDTKAFLVDNGFHVSSPLRELGRRSYKFELAENAYLLVIFRSLGVGEFEARCESFMPGGDPVFKKTIVRVSEVGDDWARNYFQHALDSFVEALAGDTAAANNRKNNTGANVNAEELVAA